MSLRLTRRDIEIFLRLPPEEQEARIAAMSFADMLAFDAAFELWAHDAQLPPPSEGWRVWLMMAGRGFGKTRAGAEWIHQLAVSGPKRIALIGATIDEARMIMVEGVSGLLAVADNHRSRVRWEPSRNELTWPSGSVATLFSGESPDRLRGPEHHFAWVLTFEVEADEGPVALADLLLDASGGSIAAGSERRIAGFAAHGSSIGDAVRTLIELSGCQLTDRDMALRTPPADPPVQIAELELGCDPEGERQPVVEQFRTAAAALPASLTMTYYNARSDYQAGQVRASAGSGARGDAVELPAVLDDGEARQLAEEALAARWRRAERIRLNLSPARIGMAPGAALQLPGSGRVWIATKVEIAGMAVLVEAEAAPVAVAPLPSDGGRPVREPDVPVGRTVLTLFELPDIDGGPSATVKLAIAGSTAGQWKPVPVAVEVGGAGQAGIVLGRQAVCGRAMSALGAAPTNLVDEQSCVLLRLENGAQTLLNADFDALAGGANLAILGDELIQFARAERIEPGLFRLFTLLRGQRGTEWATAGHAIGERFCLLDARFLGQVELPLSALGAEVRCTAHGIGDAAPLPTAARTVTGESLRPLSPCHLTVGRSGNGLILTWVRRSRSSWAWIDGVGDGADDISELYRVTAAGPLGAITFETAERLAMLDPGQIPAAQGQEVSLSVAAIGSATMSHAATAHIIL